MINYDDIATENIKKHNSNWSLIPDHPYKILMIRSSELGKINSLFNLTSQQLDIDKNILYAKYPYEAKY